MYPVVRRVISVEEKKSILVRPSLGVGKKSSNQFLKTGADITINCSRNSIRIFLALQVPNEAEFVKDNEEQNLLRGYAVDVFHTLQQHLNFTLVNRYMSQLNAPILDNITMRVF